MNDNIVALRIKRQGLEDAFSVNDYETLFSDISPVQSVYFHGFGQPPCLPYRADFNDTKHNRNRQLNRTLIKGRFQGGNVGWIEENQLELFIALYLKPIKQYTTKQQQIYDLIVNNGPLTIQNIKEMTGMLVKEITPILHKLQQEYTIYEDQNDGEWDRGWYCFKVMFPNVNKDRYSKIDAMQLILKRFIYRNVFVTEDMVKSFYKFTLKDIKNALTKLVENNEIDALNDGFVLSSDYKNLHNEKFSVSKSIYVLDRNDFLVKSNDYWLKEKFSTGGTTLQYILINGEFRGAVKGKFKYGPYIIEDVITDLKQDELSSYQEQIIKTILDINPGSIIERFCGNKISS